MLWGYKPIVQCLGLFDGGLIPFFTIEWDTWWWTSGGCFVLNMSDNKQGHVVNYGPAVFASSQHGPCIKSTTLTGFMFSFWKTSIHFRWYLHDFEAMNSQFHPCLASMCNTRVWKNRTFCLSTWRPSQSACSTCLRCRSLCDKQTQTRSLGWIHSHLQWAYACCTAPWVYFLKRLPLPIYTLRARCLLAWPTLLTKLHPFVGHLCKFHLFAMRQSLPSFGPISKKSCRSMRALHQSSSNNIRLRFRWWSTRRSHELIMWQLCHQEPTIASALKQASPAPKE